MDLNFIIKDILTRREGVVIPGLGSITVEYQPATIDQQRKVIRPPRRNIRFKPLVKADNDQVLANSLAEKENLPLSKAQLQVNEFVDTVKRELSRSGAYELKGIGKFQNTERGDTELITEQTIESDLGFEEIPAEPFELDATTPPQKIASSPTPSAPRKSRKKPILWITGVILLLIVAGGGYYTGFWDYLAFKIEKKITSRQVPPGKPVEKKQQQPAKMAADTLVPEDIKGAVEEMTDKKRALMYEPPKDTNTYYLVAGSFRVYDNARQFMNQLKDKGYSADILQNDSLYRVTIKAFDKKEDALVKLYQMRDRKKLKSIWLLTVPEKDH